MEKKILVLPELYNKVNTGGPFAIVRKMADLNDKDFDYIKKEESIERENNIKKIFENLLNFLYLIYREYIIYKKLENYNIKEYSKIISHDLYYSFVIILLFKKIKLVTIYHGQGSLYNEYIDLGNNKKSFLVKLLLNFIEYYVYKKSNIIGFPSYGSIDALIKTNKNLKNILNIRKDNIKILNNSFEEKKYSIENNNVLEKNIIINGYNFVSICNLNNAKGADRIPMFLGKLKEKGINFSWTIVGKGILSEKIKEEINKNKINENTNLIEGGFKKEEILGLLEKTDFYILFHRYSIFDLATLEAMYYKNIPILSNIGGNKEVIIDKNGLLIEENNFCNVNYFLNFIKNNNLDFLKEKNKDIVKKYFNNEIFIKNYLKIFK